MKTTYALMNNEDIQMAMEALLIAFEKADYKLEGITFTVKQDSAAITFMGMPVQVEWT